MKQIVVVVGGVLLLITLSAAATPQQIAISVSPHTAFEPTDLIIRVVAEPNADNRRLSVVAESDEFSSGSDRQLDGADGPRRTQFEWRQLPAGVYEISAVLIGVNGKARARARAEVRVFPRGQDH